MKKDGRRQHVIMYRSGVISCVESFGVKSAMNETDQAGKTKHGAVVSLLGADDRTREIREMRLNEKQMTQHEWGSSGTAGDKPGLRVQ